MMSDLNISDIITSDISDLSTFEISDLKLRARHIPRIRRSVNIDQ
jgi:hypothetical protein